MTLGRKWHLRLNNITADSLSSLNFLRLVALKIDYMIPLNSKLQFRLLSRNTPKRLAVSIPRPT